MTLKAFRWIPPLAAWTTAISFLAGAPDMPEESRAGKIRGADHWAFQPIRRPAPPAVKDAGWPKNPIDSFILARLEKEGMAPEPEADRATLIRRLSLDLLGLPPSPEEVEEFLDDERPGAYEALVDRLLLSPHHGERWARHWLDLARYADSNGYTIDGSRSIWKYRDWVIEALNRDLPFDRFAMAQIAGDLLPDGGLTDLVATGFHRNTLRNEEGGTDPEQFRVEAVADRVSTTATVFLGITAGCARCHDHKYDPISQREYFQLFALFNSSEEETLAAPTSQKARELPALETEIAAAEKLLAENEAAVARRQGIWEKALEEEGAGLSRAGLPEDVRRILARPPAERSPEERERVAAHYRSIDKDRVPLAARVAELKGRREQLERSTTTTLVLRERSSPRETRVHLRGDFLRPGEKVEGGVPAVLPPLESRGKRPDRLDLARWLVDRRNPLTARVAVNRLWQAYFGRGIVPTENDFGTQGDPPSHPELLDWLASELLERGWSQRALHRLIVTSATYRQSSRLRPGALERDPPDRLLGRQTRLRLEAEVIRDSALAASGLLSREIGGPGVYPPQPQGFFKFTQTAKYWKESQGADRFRRAMYTFFWRSSPYPFLMTFDAPEATVSCTRRARSNTPLQALTLANDPAFFEMAQALAGRVLAEAGPADTARIDRLFRLCLARAPAEPERERLQDFLQKERRKFSETSPEEAAAAAPARLPEGTTVSEGAAWTALARVVLNLDEFITRE
jgi:hypothetical protein